MDINHDTGAPVSLDALFGAVLRAFRKRGLRETAAKIPINFSYLAKWERGERPVPQEMVAMLDQAYAANGTLITLHELIKRDRPHAALAGRTIVGALPSGTSAGDGGVRRAVRRLLPTISAATATPIDALQALAALEDLTGGITATLVERDGIDPERLVWECGLACCTARPGAALARLTLDYAPVGASADPRPGRRERADRPAAGRRPAGRAVGDAVERRRPAGHRRPVLATGR